MGVPNRKVKVWVIFNNREDETVDNFMNLALRRKGENGWISLSDIVQFDKTNDTFYLGKCLRCNTDLQRGTNKCPKCGAALSGW